MTSTYNLREILIFFRIPTFSITLPNNPSLFPYPENGAFNVAALTKFVTDFFERKLIPFE